MDTMATLIDALKSTVKKIPDPRTGANTRYLPSDLVLSALACFVSQDGSFLQSQRRMQDNTQLSNMATLYGVKKIPSDDQIRNFIDQVDPHYFDEIYYKIFETLISKKLLDHFKVLDNQYFVIALDGTQYFSSKTIHCDNCIIKEHNNGEIEYVHSVLGASIVSPNTNSIIALPPEHNTKDDTTNKQDCEQKAIFRWLDKHFTVISKISGTKNFLFLTDDLHSHDPFVGALLEYGASFVLVCKESSHKSLYEFTQYNPLNAITYYDKVKGFEDQKLHTIRWLSGLPLHDLSESHRVNWISLEIEGVKKHPEIIKTQDKNKKKKNERKITYQSLIFTFITNIPVNENNVKELIEIGRARWKIENNTFRTLKHGGYNLEHNYGHGKKFLSATLITLNILAYLFHTVLYLEDWHWKNEYDRIGNRIKFFNKLNSLLGKEIFCSFNELFTRLVIARPPPTLQNRLITIKINYHQKMISNLYQRYTF
jgi:hypothetical protein